MTLNKLKKKFTENASLSLAFASVKVRVSLYAAAPLLLC